MATSMRSNSFILLNPNAHAASSNHDDAACHRRIGPDFLRQTINLLTAMFFESFFQDLRIGLRMLVKDKTFFILARHCAPRLGICGVTTQFTMVNAIMLRGFSFPHPEELMSVGLIDPQASDQTNNFGNGNIPSSQDYEDLRAGQKSFALMSAYLNGSTINVTYKKTPQRYTGGYVTEDFFKIIDVKPILGRDFTAEDNKPGSREGDDPRQRNLEARFQWRPAYRWPGSSDQWQSRYHHRRHAAEL